MPVGVQSRPSNFSMEIYFVKSISCQCFDWKNSFHYVPFLFICHLKFFWYKYFGQENYFALELGIHYNLRSLENILRPTFWMKYFENSIFDKKLTSPPFHRHMFNHFFCHSNRVWKQYFGQKNDFSPYLGHIFQCPCCLKIFWGNVNKSLHSFCKSMNHS